MRKLIITSIVLFIGFIALGQNDYENIIEGSVFKDKTKWSSVIFSEDDGNGGLILVRTFHVARRHAEAYYIEHYSKDLKLIKRAKVDNVSSNIIIDNGIINMIDFNTKTKGYEFNLISSPINTLKFKKKKLCSIGKDDKLGVSLFAVTKSHDSGSFGTVSFSENKNYFTLSFDIKNEDVATHKIFVYNKQFEKVNDYTFKKNIKDNLFDFESVNVDDTDGSVFLLGKVFENNSRASKIDDKINYHFELYKLTNSGQEKIILNTDNNFIEKLKPVSKGNKLSYVGFYGKNKKKKTSGVCRFDINTEKFELINKSFNKFSDQFIIDKYGKISDKESKDLFLDDVHMLDNGDVIITGEEYYITTSEKKIIPHYNDIVSIKIDDKGKLIWARNINKKQIGSIYTSYGSIVKNGNLLLLFNASNKVKELKNEEVEFKKFKRGNSAIYCVSIDENGNLNHKIIYEKKKSKILFQFRHMIIDDEENIILLGVNNLEKQLMKIKL